MAKKRTKKELNAKKLTKAQQAQKEQTRREEKRRNIIFYTMTAVLFILFCVAGVL